MVREDLVRVVALAAGLALAGCSGGLAVVVIRWRNLRPAQVLFGMAPARILEATAEAVKVAVPQSGAGEVPVVLTNADGAYAVAMHAFRYYR
jgi:hypothetical protein